MEEDAVPILLERPLLYTAMALLAMVEGELIIHYFDEQLTFWVADILKRPKSMHSIFFADLMDLDPCEVVEPILPMLPLDRCITCDVKKVISKEEEYCFDHLKQHK